MVYSESITKLEVGAEFMALFGETAEPLVRSWNACLSSFRFAGPQSITLGGMNENLDSATCNCCCLFRFFGK
jgi:hypothetical protein